MSDENEPTPDEAKQCPFCGSHEIFCIDIMDRVSCQSCGARGPKVSENKNNKTEHVNLWNTRPIEGELKAEIEELEAEIKEVRATCETLDDEYNKSISEQTRLAEENDSLKSLLSEYRLWQEEIESIVDDSEGVAGWHRNGDVAEWDYFGLFSDMSTEAVDKILKEYDDGGEV